jgi:hypothetical protein
MVNAGDAQIGFANGRLTVALQANPTNRWLVSPDRL